MPSEDKWKCSIHVDLIHLGVITCDHYSSIFILLRLSVFMSKCNCPHGLNFSVAIVHICPDASVLVYTCLYFLCLSRVKCSHGLYLSLSLLFMIWSDLSVLVFICLYCPYLSTWPIFVYFVYICLDVSNLGCTGLYCLYLSTCKCYPNLFLSTLSLFVSMQVSFWSVLVNISQQGQGSKSYIFVSIV